MAKNDANLREELSELTEAVRGLRENETADEIRRLRAEVEHLRADRAGNHHCHGCHCLGHYIWPGYTWYPTTISYGTTNVGGTVAAGTTTTINCTDASNYALGSAGTNALS